ncbi:MAG: MFS transporter, partial [Verrucomicrobiaceae bacterium]
MSESIASTPLGNTERPAANTVYTLLFAISFSHMLNDTIQALLPSIYPLLKSSYHLSFTQLGMITFTFQLTASLLQPLVGFVTDRKP